MLIAVFMKTVRDVVAEAFELRRELAKRYPFVEQE